MSKYVQMKRIQNIYPKNRDHQITGSLGERIARKFLEGRGYVFRSANEHTHWGEIDLIMDDMRGVPTFVEVKMKRNRLFGYPEDQFHVRKRQKIKRAIEWYCLRNEIARYQVDLVAIEVVDRKTEIRHYQNVELG